MLKPGLLELCFNTEYMVLLIVHSWCFLNDNDTPYSTTFISLQREWPSWPLHQCECVCDDGDQWWPNWSYLRNANWLMLNQLMWWPIYQQIACDQIVWKSEYLQRQISSLVSLSGLLEHSSYANVDSFSCSNHQAVMSVNFKILLRNRIYTRNRKIIKYLKIVIKDA